MVERGASPARTNNGFSSTTWRKTSRASKVNVNKATASEIAAPLEITGKEAESICHYRRNMETSRIGMA